MVVLSIYPDKIICQETIRECLCLYAPRSCMNTWNLSRNDVYNLFVNTHVRIQLYGELYHGLIYKVNEGRPDRI